MTGTESRRLAFERVLPRIRTHAVIVFRDVRCPHRKEDLIAETLALAWAWWIRLCHRGKRPELFVSAIATFAARAARSGRRVCGSEPSRDVLSGVAQRRHGFCVGNLPDGSAVPGHPAAESLRNPTEPPVPEQVACRFDYPAWLRTHDGRQRRLLEAMANGERTQDLAARFGLSAARISQLRREFMVGWSEYTGADGWPASRPG